MARRSSLLPPLRQAEADLGRASLIRAALFCRCPRCGVGRAFSGFLTTAERCGSCGLGLAAMDSGDGPAVFLIFILGFAVVPLAIWASNVVDLPYWLQSLFWGVVILGLTVGMLRPAKALVLALNYRHRSDRPG
jgi:uncharacterized protein (DUF983 family)